MGEFYLVTSWCPTHHEWLTYRWRFPSFCQILSDVYQVSCLVGALYDMLTIGDWRDQEITNTDITLYMIKLSDRTLTELFTSCQNLLKCLLPPRFYHLQICSEHQPNNHPSRHYIVRYCMRPYSPDAILTSNGPFLSQMERRE